MTLLPFAPVAHATVERVGAASRPGAAAVRSGVGPETEHVLADPASLALLERLRLIAPSESSVLITGETGTGKEWVARQLHGLSRRHAGPFVPVNCGALAESLADSELFGHERGAFTGAVGARSGWFEAASGGTLFLDEVGDLPLALQVKLLRVLQEREVVRLGGQRGIPVDLRIVAATHVPLHAAVAAGRFREDLFYRLHGAHLAVPPLRDRPGDILPLARQVLRRHRQLHGGGPQRLSPAAEQRLLQHRWPGNIRELENTVQHSALLCRHELLDAADLQWVALPVANPAAASATLPEPPAPHQALEAALRALFEAEPGGDRLFERIEQTVMRAALDHCRRNQVQAARLLDISRNVLRARLIRSGDIQALA